MTSGLFGTFSFYLISDADRINDKNGCFPSNREKVQAKIFKTNTKTRQTNNWQFTNGATWTYIK